MKYFICFLCKDSESLFISNCYHIVCSSCLFFKKNIIDCKIDCPICNCITEFKEFKKEFKNEQSIENLNILLAENSCLKTLNGELKNRIKKYKLSLKEVYFKMTDGENHEHK